MPWTSAQLKDAVARLTPPDEHTTYAVEGDALVGRWRFDAGWVGPTGGGTQARGYEVVVELDESEHSYRTHEDETGSGAGGGLRARGAGAKAEKSFFSGHLVKKSFEIGAAPTVSSSHADSDVSYRVAFDSQQVKRPLVDLLEQAGWQNDQGLLSRLLGG